MKMKWKMLSTNESETLRTIPNTKTSLAKCDHSKNLQLIIWENKFKQANTIQWWMLVHQWHFIVLMKKTGKIMSDRESKNRHESRQNWMYRI